MSQHAEDLALIANIEREMARISACRNAVNHVEIDGLLKELREVIDLAQRYLIEGRVVAFGKEETAR